MSSKSSLEEEKKNIDEQSLFNGLSTYSIERALALEKERESFIREKDRVLAERNLIIKNIDGKLKHTIEMT